MKSLKFEAWAEVDQDGYIIWTAMETWPRVFPNKPKGPRRVVRVDIMITPVKRKAKRAAARGR